MNYKRYQERWQRKYVWLYKYMGKGRTQYILMQIFALLFFGLTCMFCLWWFGDIFSLDMSSEIRIILFIIMFDSLATLFIGTRMRYWREALILQAMLNISINVQFLIAGFALLLESKQTSDFLVLIVGLGVLISILLILDNGQREARQWDLARRKGFLKNYLDEENWVFDNDPTKWTALWFDIAAAGKSIEQQKSLLRWLTRLEKLHFLIPGIMISFRRAFGQEAIIISIFLISLGLLFAGAIPIAPYLKACEWEKERGKPIFLRDVWEKESHKET